MCEPTTIAAVAIGASAIGAATSAYGAIQQGQAQSAAAAAQAQQARNNAVLADRAASDALARGDVADQQKANQTAALMGRQRAGLASNGLDANSGSAVDLQSDTAGAGELDQLTIHSNALREATGYKAQGMNYSTQASVDEASSANALTAGELGATSSIIGGAGSVASSWYNYKFGTRGYGAGNGISGGL